ncbi:glycosyltransferase family 2 protein [Candidatus Woesearchaeota archaeon]|nr:glycosyltransferase family 2 protein [Candidatus Woesearchaeota archaeon]
MKIVIVIPAYNEEETIGQVIEQIPRNCAKKVQVLVIDDGSRDRTVEVAKKAGADKIISHNTNLGLGAAFKNGIDEALKMGADIIVNIDADGQFNPQDIAKIIRPIVDNKADMVTCSRFKNPKLTPDMPKLKIIGNKFFAKLLNLFLKKNYHDTQCGFRAYSKEAALNLTLFGRYTYTQEVFIDLIKKRFRIMELPCVVKGERKGRSRLVKSILSYGFKVMLIIIRSMRDYEPLKFFGGTGAVLFLTGVFSSLLLFIRFLIVNKYDPYMSLIYLNIFLIVIGFLLIILGLIADMLDRNRQLQEEILYKLKKQELENKNIK